MFGADICGFLGPQGGLYLSVVCLPEEEHTDAGLADSAADGKGKLLLDDRLLEGKRSPFRTASLFQLGKKEALCQKVQKN